MDSQGTPLTVQLGQNASIRVGGTVINTRSQGATVQFGSFGAVPLFNTATAIAPACGTPARGHAAGPQSANAPARRAVQPVQASDDSAEERPKKRVSVFDRLGGSAAPVTKRISDGQKVSLISEAAGGFHAGPFVPGKYDAEASSSGGRLNRRQRRKRNAELRAQGLPTPSGIAQAVQAPAANVHIHNRFDNLKWVRKDSSTDELKKSFHRQLQQAPPPSL